MTYIAIATDDGESVRFGHFGDAERYLIYNIDSAGNSHFVETRENRYTDARLGLQQHNQPEKAKMMVQFLRDCRVFVGHSMGNKNKRILEKNGVLPLALQQRNIPVAEALERAKQALREAAE